MTTFSYTTGGAGGFVKGTIAVGWMRGIVVGLSALPFTDIECYAHLSRKCNGRSDFLATAICGKPNTGMVHFKVQHVQLTKSVADLRERPAKLSPKPATSLIVSSHDFGSFSNCVTRPASEHEVSIDSY